MAAHLRRSYRRRGEVSDEALQGHADGAPGSDDLLDQRRARALLDEVLDALPMDARAVFVLFELEEMTVPEIAALLDVPLGTAASRLRRGRELFEAEITRRKARLPQNSMGNLVSVNNAFLQACACPPAGPLCVAGGKPFMCTFGDRSLLGTGFGKDGIGSSHGSTSWLTTSAPVAPVGVITLRWTIYDSGDGILDSTTLVDNWTWSATPTPVLTYRPMKP